MSRHTLFAVLMLLAARQAYAYTCSPGPPQHPEDATEELQWKVDNCAEVILPSGSTWNTKTIYLTSHGTIELGENVVWQAVRSGWFEEDCERVLIRGADVSCDNVTITGSSGAVVRMFKEDYFDYHCDTEYEQNEFRHAIFLQDCDGVWINGPLTIEGAGGDGLVIGAYQRFSSYNIYVDGVTFHENARNNLFIQSGSNIHITNSSFDEAGKDNLCEPLPSLKGVACNGPWAGIDLEPDKWWHRLREITIDDCTFWENRGPGLNVELNNLSSEYSAAVSIASSRAFIRGTGAVECLQPPDCLQPPEWRQCCIHPQYGIRLAGPAAVNGLLWLTGSVNIYESHIEHTAYAGIAFDNWAFSGPTAGIFGCTIDQPNVDIDDFVGNGAAIAAFIRPDQPDRYLQGNVLISGCRLTRPGSYPWAFSASGSAGSPVGGVDGTIFVEPTNEGGMWFHDVTADIPNTIATLRDSSVMLNGVMSNDAWLTPLDGDRIDYFEHVGDPEYGPPLYYAVDVNSNYAVFVVDLRQARDVSMVAAQNRIDVATNYNVKSVRVYVASDESSINFRPFRRSAFNTTAFQGDMFPVYNTSGMWRYLFGSSVHKRYFLIEVRSNFWGPITPSNPGAFSDLVIG